MKYIGHVMVLGSLLLATGGCDRGVEANRDHAENKPPIGRPATAASQAEHPAPTANPQPDEDEEPLLLLLEEEVPKEDLPPPTGPVADNSRCHVCHINYADDKLATTHARNNVGCEVCHGDSSAHCSDEDNVTPPEVMFAESRINPACRKCHARLSDQHAPFLAGQMTEKYCTDCHGFDEHRLSYRTRHWDKKTGQLIKSDTVRMLDETPASQ